jgi:hypothetical protein
MLSDCEGVNISEEIIKPDFEIALCGFRFYTAAKIIEALKVTKGMVYLASEVLGCSPATVYNYAKKYPTIQAAIEAERGKFLDKTELKLDEAVDNGEGWAIAFALKTLGKHRGYTEKQLIEQQLVNLDIPWDKLTNEQISRLAAGESLSDVLGD